MIKEGDLQNIDNLESNSNKKIIILSVLIIILIILISVFLVYLFTRGTKIEIGESIEAVSFNKNMEEMSVKLNKALNLSEIEKVKFLFINSLGEEYLFESPEASYKYKINAESIGLENFKDIKQIYVIFTYINGSVSEIPSGTTSTGTGTTTPSGGTSGGGGSGGGGGGPEPGTTTPSCGDGTCNGDETCDTCPGDCGECVEKLDLSNNTLILYNENAGDALEIAQYYANARGIGYEYICPIKLPTGQFATAEQLLGVRKTIVENCLCNIIDGLTRPCDISNINEIAEKSPITHLAIIKGIPPRLTGTGWPDDSEEPSLDYYLSHMLYRNTGNIFTDDDGRLTGIIYSGELPDSQDFQISDSIGSYIRKINPYLDRAVAYGRIEAMTKQRTYELIDRTILAENSGVSGNFFRGPEWIGAYVSNDIVYAFFRKLTSSLDSRCIDYLNNSGSWNSTICRAGATNGEVPGEATSEILEPINAGIYLGGAASMNSHNAFDGFNNMLNWRKTNEDCIPLCKDTANPDDCRSNSKDYFKEINTDCVGVADGFLGFQYISWPVQYYGFWPYGWSQISGGNGAYQKTPPVILNETGNNYLHFGALDSVENPQCVLGDGTNEECKEMIGVNLRNYVYLSAGEYILINGEKYIKVKFKHRNPTDSNARVSFTLVSYFTDNNSTSSTQYVYLNELATDWVEENLIFNMNNDGKTIKQFRLDITSSFNNMPLDWLEFDDFEIINCDDSSCVSGINLVDVDTGSFNKPYYQTTAGDYASNVIDRIGGIGWWGSSSHFLTSGTAFGYANKFTGAFYSGRSLGESLLYTDNGMSGIIYGDPLYKPSGVKIYVNDGLNQFNSEDKAINFNLSSSGNFNISINAFHGQNNLESTQWQLTTCHDTIENCDASNSWVEIMAGTGAKFEFNTGIQLMDLLQSPEIDQKFILRLRVWNPGEENNDLKNYGYFNYTGCLIDDDCKNPLTPLCHPVERICVSCYDNAHCSEPTPICSPSHTCGECVTDSDCINQLRPYCNPDFICNSRRYCYLDNECNSNEKCWLNNFCYEITCLEDKDCEDFDDCSEDKCVNNYCEFTKMTNEENCYYCSNFSICNDVGGMNICGGADINRNGSVGGGTGQEDLIILQANWRAKPCNETNNFCEYADINRKTEGPPEYGVYTNDLNILTAHNGETCNLESWRACELGIINEEICDGFDNDCDSLIDEDNVCGFPSLSFWKTIIDWVKKLFMIKT